MRSQAPRPPLDFQLRAGCADPVGQEAVAPNPSWFFLLKGKRGNKAAMSPRGRGRAEGSAGRMLEPGLLPKGKSGMWAPPWGGGALSDRALLVGGDTPSF